jgi:hypothetical protein
MEQLDHNINLVLTEINISHKNEHNHIFTCKQYNCDIVLGSVSGIIISYDNDISHVDELIYRDEKWRLYSEHDILSSNELADKEMVLRVAERVMSKHYVANASMQISIPFFTESELQFMKV